MQLVSYTERRENALKNKAHVIKNYDAEKTSNIILDIIKREQEQ